jgi:KipI family sensor histidine kinase inhibitor
MRLLPAGDRAVLADLTDAAATAAFFRALGEDRPAGVEDLVPAEVTVLVRYDPAVVAPAELGHWLRSALDRSRLTGPGGGPSGAGCPAGAAVEVEIPVVYAGADLAEVGRLTGLGADGVVAAHTGTPWRVAFTGFSPGFGYLVDGDPRLEVPRRDVSRTRVPAGSVGLGGRYSGVYPRESPGGWQLLGRTALAVWDAERDPPALLRPGTTVRFVAVDGP